MENDILKLLEYIQTMQANHDYVILSKTTEEYVKKHELSEYESVQTNEINAALAKAQGEFPRIGFNRENPYFKSGYTDLDAIMHVIRPILAKNGLALTQQEKEADTGATILHTKLRHSSGQFIASKRRIVPLKNDQHSYASALTYAKRYSAMALLNITTTEDGDDDDAEKAQSEFREVQVKGTALNTKYNPKEVGNFETITKEQLEELNYELGGHPDIAEQVLDGLKIQALADMPKTKYLASITRVRQIKNSREGIK